MAKRAATHPGTGLSEGDLTPGLDLDLDLLEYLQTLTPAERLRRHESARELVAALRRAGTKHYGFDPRVVVDPDFEEG